ncbi:MAG: PfkB family carbohydrate kinase [Actinomycetota bacterium]
MSSQRLSLLAVGEAMLDVIVQESASGGRPIHAPIHLDAGGTPVNAALAAAALGASAAVCARVGADPAGAAVRDALEAKGVAAMLAVDATAPTGVFVSVGEQVATDRGANDLLAPVDFDGLPEHDALLVSGYTFRAATIAAARHALASSSARWRGVDLGGAPPAADPVGANVLFGTLEELGGGAPDALARELAEGFEIVVVKLGADGALIGWGEEQRRLPPASHQADGAVGAGDALDGGVLAGLARGLGPVAALELGLTAAAAHIGRRREALTRP